MPTFLFYYRASQYNCYFHEHSTQKRSVIYPVNEIIPPLGDGGDTLMDKKEITVNANLSFLL
jgi:hypothetical protein